MTRVIFMVTNTSCHHNSFRRTTARHFQRTMMVTLRIRVTNTRRNTNTTGAQLRFISSRQALLLITRTPRPRVRLINRLVSTTLTLGQLSRSDNSYARHFTTRLRNFTTPHRTRPVPHIAHQRIIRLLQLLQISRLSIRTGANGQLAVLFTMDRLRNISRLTIRTTTRNSRGQFSIRLHRIILASHFRRLTRNRMKRVIQGRSNKRIRLITIRLGMDLITNNRINRNRVRFVRLLLRNFLPAVFHVFSNSFRQLNTTIKRHQGMTLTIIRFTVRHFTRFTPRLPNDTTRQRLHVRQRINTRRITRLVSGLQIVITMRHHTMTTRRVNSNSFHTTFITMGRLTTRHPIRLTFRTRHLRRFSGF